MGRAEQVLGFPVGPVSIASVSCADATDCTAVGYDGGTVYVNAQPFYVKSTVPPSPPPTIPPPPPLVPTPPVPVAPTPPTPQPTPPVSTPAPPVSIPPVVTSPSSSASHGYWLVGSDGGIFTFGDRRVLWVDGQPQAPASRGWHHTDSR